jgi:hypothetical protein
MPGQSTDQRNTNERAVSVRQGDARTQPVSGAVSHPGEYMRETCPPSAPLPLSSHVRPSDAALVGMALVPAPFRNALWNAFGYPVDQRIVFVEAVAQIRPFYALRVLPLLALPHEDQRGRVADVLIRTIPEEVAREVPRLGIRERSRVFDIAAAAVSAPVAPLFFPKWRSKGDLPRVVARLPLPEVDKARLFAQALRSRPLQAPEFLDTLGIQSAEARALVARAVVRQGDLASLISQRSPLVEALTPQWLADVHERRVVAEAAAARAPSKLTEILRLSDLQDREHRLGVVLSAAQSGRDFPFEALPSLGIRDEATVVGIFHAVARWNSVNAIGALVWQRTISEETRMKIIERALSNEERILDARLLVDAVFLNGISDLSERKRCAMLIGRKAGWSLNVHALSRLGLKSREDRLAYACEVAQFSAPPPSEILRSKLEIDRREDVTAIFLSAISGEAADPLGALPGDFTMLNREDRLKLYQTAVSLRVDGLSMVARLFSNLPIERLLGEIVGPALRSCQESWGATREIGALRRIGCILRGLAESSEFTALEHKGESDTVLGRIVRALARLEELCPEVRTNRILLEAIQEPLSLDGATVVAGCCVVRGREFEVCVSPVESLAVVCGIDGLHGVHLSSRQFRSLTETLGSLYGPSCKQMPPVSSMVSIAREVWEQDFQGALDCVVARGSLFSIGSESPRTSVYVTCASLNDARAVISAELSAALRNALGIASEEGALGLANRWGDISPVAILLARFRRGFQQEIPILADVVERTLNGSFLDTRYDPAYDQFAGFSESMRARWRENPHRLTLARAGEDTQPSREHKRSAVDALYVQMLEHCGDAADVMPLSRSLSSESLEVLARLKQTDFSEWYTSYEQQHPRKTVHHILAAVGCFLRADRIDDLRCFLRNVATIKSRIGADLPEAQRRGLFADLKALSEVIKERQVEKGRGYLVFTTITDDPKLMLMSGDLVSTASCQNYKTGSHAHTLLSYVIDGNIKASLSFVIAESFVRSVFQRSGKRDVTIQTLRPSFDAPKLELTLTDQEGAAHTFPLGKAIRRRILRTGQRLSDGVPCMFAERPYELLHAVSSTIAAEEEALFAEVEKRCGFMPAVGSVEYPATLNPLGAYSDFAQAVMSGPYSLYFDTQSVRRGV